MGHPVVHFEVIGSDAAKLQSNYSELFGWELDADNPQFTDPKGNVIGLMRG
jgi:predicted enzyme related to lactoylglutathione lyase